MEKPTKTQVEAVRSRVFFKLVEKHPDDYNSYPDHPKRTHLFLVDPSPNTAYDNDYQLSSYWSFFLQPDGTLVKAKRFYSEDDQLVVYGKGLPGYAHVVYVALLEGYEGPDFTAKSPEEVLTRVGLTAGNYGKETRTKLTKLYRSLTSKNLGGLDFWSGRGKETFVVKVGVSDSDFKPFLDVQGVEVKVGDKVVYALRGELTVGEVVKVAADFSKVSVKKPDGKSLQVRSVCKL